MNSRKDVQTSYDILHLQNRVAELNFELSNLKGKIKLSIDNLEKGNNYCHECGIDYQDYAREILEDLIKE